MSKNEVNKASHFLKKSIRDFELIEANKISKENPSFLNENNTFLDALELSKENPKEVIVITNSQGIVGTLNKLEIISKINEKNISGLDKIKIKEIMNKKFTSCSSDDNLKKIYENMIKANADVIILIKENKFLGLIDYFDLIRIFENTNFVIKNPPIVKEAIKKEINKINADANLLELKNNFVINKSNYCIVYKNNLPVGIVTIKDLISPLFNNSDLKNIQVQHIMSARMVSIEPWKNLHEAMSLALEKRFNQIPIKEGENIIGILNLRNAIKTYYEFLQNLEKGNYLIEKI